MLIELLYGVVFVLAIFSALMVVLAPHPVYNALYLVLTMVSIAVMFVMMNAQLAAAFQIIVYAGAIMVLFLFVIMLLSLGRQKPPALRTRPARVIGLLLAVAFILQMISILASLDLTGVYTLENPEGAGAQSVATLLLTDYIYAFEMTSVLLLVAVVGAIVLARRHLVQGVADVEKVK